MRGSESQLEKTYTRRGRNEDEATILGDAGGLDVLVAFDLKGGKEGIVRGFKGLARLATFRHMIDVDVMLPPGYEETGSSCRSNRWLLGKVWKCAVKSFLALFYGIDDWCSISTTGCQDTHVFAFVGDHAFDIIPVEAAM